MGASTGKHKMRNVLVKFNLSLKYKSKTSNSGGPECEPEEPLDQNDPLKVENKAICQPRFFSHPVYCRRRLVRTPECHPCFSDCHEMFKTCEMQSFVRLVELVVLRIQT